MAASASNIYTMESANMICGNTGNKTAPGITTHLVLQELKLPGLEENYVDHAPAGASVAIEINTHINKLEATFNLAGWDPDVMVYFGREEFRYHQFTAYGLIRDRRQGVALGAYAKFQGRLGRVNPTAFSKGNLMAHEYSIKSIVHYELTCRRRPARRCGKSTSGISSPRNVASTKSTRTKRWLTCCIFRVSWYDSRRIGQAVDAA